MFQEFKPQTGGAEGIKNKKQDWYLYWIWSFNTLATWCEEPTDW